ncbi:MAG: glycosyltransferase [Bacteroidales bacterium]|jgi:hypothetical protein|nr:glycosyltransferase [Bacteroidales bacterium]
MNKKILITTYYFYPLNKPRAFRVFELVKAFAAKKYNVSVIIPDNDYNYETIENKYGIKIIKIPIGFFLYRKKMELSNQNRNSTNKDVKLVKWVKNLFGYIYFDKKATEFCIPLSRFLKKFNNDYDVIIGMGLPFSVILGTAMGVKKKNSRATIIAEYSDPFSENNAYNKLFLFKFVERFIIKRFHWIIVPTEKAIKSFLPLMHESRIKVIPQGVDIESFSICQYKKNKVVTFGYAGILYLDIRNPKVLLDYLCTIRTDFRFIIYTNLMDKATLDILRPYVAKLNERLIISDLIPREEVIYNLSKMDFIINIDNLTSNQSPSKLIDYALSKRPIFSFNQNGFSSKEFDRFFTGDYSNQILVNLSDFDIRKNVNQFEKIF